MLLSSKNPVGCWRFR